MSTVDGQNYAQLTAFVTGMAMRRCCQSVRGQPRVIISAPAGDLLEAEPSVEVHYVHAAQRDVEHYLRVPRAAWEAASAMSARATPVRRWGARVNRRFTSATASSTDLSPTQPSGTPSR